MDIKNREIPADKLCLICNPDEFKFKTTKELTQWDEIIGQERAVKAIKFGLGIKSKGFNIYVSGAPGTGKNTIVKAMIQKLSKDMPVPEDWCYVYNFTDPDRPRLINLSAGWGRAFQKDMDGFIEFLNVEIPKIFESKEYEDHKSRVIAEYEKARESLFTELNERAREFGFQMSVSKTGIMKIPVIKGKPIQPQDIAGLTKDQRREIEEKEKRVDSEVRDFFSKIRILEKEANEKILDLNRQAVNFVIQPRLEELKAKFSHYAKVSDYLNSVQEDILNNLGDFLAPPPSVLPLPIDLFDRGKPFTKYKVNVIVDNQNTKGAPVIEETNPTYNNMIGRIERKAKFGTFYTDFTMVKGGSILQANGGFLIVNVLDVLRSPFSWDALKRVIKKDEVKIEDVGELYGFVSGGLKPEPIPVSVRVVVLGSPLFYHLLYTYDEDFKKIFKVKADFDVEVKGTEDIKEEYAYFIARLCENEKLLHFDREAVASTIEYAARLVDHKEKLSLRFSDICDLIRESHFWAAEDKSSIVKRAHVQKAIDEKEYRSNLIEEKIQGLIEEGTIMVSVEVDVVGQVNGLSVYDLGDFAFGKPSRITARTYPGKEGLMNIDREAKLSGRIHNKAVLILSGYLSGRYAIDKPLSLSASVCFEQSYGEVEGDSASAAELIAILSSIAEMPIKQELAITGSINQKGEIQPIGGVNEKIEGFFMVCKSKGLTSNQGVIIPHQNVKNLMLKEEVRKAVKDNKFHIYSAVSVDDCLELLTGIPAGERQKDGTFKKDTANYLIDKKLKEMAEKLKKAEKPEKEVKEKKKEKNEE
ncbi:MAG: AAA family ATPase [Nitrospirae bacterium]|nr:AAA family ATPase [Nitrospirota bacterium]